jgi:hypothetical protein
VQAPRGEAGAEGEQPTFEKAQWLSGPRRQREFWSHTATNGEHCFGCYAPLVVIQLSARSPGTLEWHGHAYCRDCETYVIRLQELIERGSCCRRTVTVHQRAGNRKRDPTEPRHCLTFE